MALQTLCPGESGKGREGGGKREWKGKEGKIGGIGWEMDDGKGVGGGGGGCGMV